MYAWFCFLFFFKLSVNQHSKLIDNQFLNIYVTANHISKKQTYGLPYTAFKLVFLVKCLK